MILKMFKALWFLSMLAVLANLLYTYASLPEQVIVQEEATGRVMANREFFFYTSMVIIALVNVMVYFTTRLFQREEDFRSWFHGLIITINIFMIFALNLVQVYNSAEVFDFSSVGFMIYGSVMLMVLWAISWPIYSLAKKFIFKQAVS
jgi:hypothetical protein